MAQSYSKEPGGQQSTGEKMCQSGLGKPAAIAALSLTYIASFVIFASIVGFSPRGDFR
ncbi:MAG: hypothetical protein AMXMBFR84_00110 [Candidatus Hydrogenedentota bacterium]